MDALPSENVRSVYDFIGSAPEILRISTAAPGLRSVIVNPRLLSERYKALAIERRLRQLVASATQLSVSVSVASPQRRRRPAMGAVSRRPSSPVHQFGIWRLGLDEERVGRTADRALGVVDATGMYEDVDELADQLDRTARVSPSVLRRLQAVAKRLEQYADSPFKN